MLDDNGNSTGNNSLTFNLIAANPSAANTVWLNSSNNHLYRGSVDLEAGAGGDLFGPASSTDNAIVRFDGATGKLVQNTTGFTCDDNFNVKIGDSTSATNRQLHLQGQQDLM